LRRLLLAFALLLAVCVSATDAHRANARPNRQSRAAALSYLEHRLQRYERATWHWQRLTGRPLTQTAGRTLAQLAVADLARTVRVWEGRVRAAHRVAQHPPHLRDWMCIHHYEGAWNDAGGPYWGGLQMSLGFQARYGGWLLRAKGTADHWTPLEQIWTAEKALRSRGFWPWPNTARMCGLI
jgi:hypothetical protein